jgi:hypothetical protein
LIKQNNLRKAKERFDELLAEAPNFARTSDAEECRQLMTEGA